MAATKSACPEDPAGESGCEEEKKEDHAVDSDCAEITAPAVYADYAAYTVSAIYAAKAASLQVLAKPFVRQSNACRELLISKIKNPILPPDQTWLLQVHKRSTTLRSAKY
ncbi:uncharacterized protein N7506_005042 [Penicillium brevicompactum]|uniref:uncharacterized protein n=1 Tax=Penicillium brevicompactum TaxID=5074 RepID=UPI00253FEC28|nr:uncharacterized protein N7506_005042 [Penicillium brevicompactum]KAJ5337020.1 hypothetical protein N7506_005042 [Penicillium brevicompactum]